MHPIYHIWRATPPAAQNSSELLLRARRCLRNMYADKFELIVAGSHPALHHGFVLGQEVGGRLLTGRWITTYIAPLFAEARAVTNALLASLAVTELVISGPRIFQILGTPPFCYQHGTQEPRGPSRNERCALQ